MTFTDRLKNEYFEWLSDIVVGTRFPREVSYRKLLMRLHSTPFTYTIPRDENRVADGIELRYRFGMAKDYPEYDLIDDPCSILEMMVALVMRCESTIMDDPEYGNRTGEWFWNMIRSLGLSSMTDSNFDRDYVDEVLTRFLNRDYEPDGKGGLFYIKNYERDLRNVEIWYQLCWYLDSIV